MSPSVKKQGVMRDRSAYFIELVVKSTQSQVILLAQLLRPLEDFSGQCGLETFEPFAHVGCY